MASKETITMKAAEGLSMCHLVDEDCIDPECIPGEMIREGRKG